MCEGGGVFGGERGLMHRGGGAGICLCLSRVCVGGGGCSLLWQSGCLLLLGVKQRRTCLPPCLAFLCRS